MHINRAQRAMAERGIDAWLLYDFRGSNPVLAHLLPPQAEHGGGVRWTTRRVLLLVPRNGTPRLLVHTIDAPQFAGVGAGRWCEKQVYRSWQDLHAWLDANLRGVGRVAMEYSPDNAIPAVSLADAGIVDLVRKRGVQVMSSADLIQTTVAVWTARALEAHAEASCKVAGIKTAAFDLIREALARGTTVTEHNVQRFIQDEFARAGLETADAPIVAVNGHSGDPHFEVPESGSSAIERGDWVLIDLWARRPGDENIFSDITWVGCAGEPTARQGEVFGVVRGARDAALDAVRAAWAGGRTIRGWEVDDAARLFIEGAGLGEFVRHRTGHSLSPGPKVHGLGVNIDNLETHDTREVLPGIGFTIEPGVYTPEFGVRLEINVYVDPAAGPRVTSCVQDEIVRLD